MNGQKSLDQPAISGRDMRGVLQALTILNALTSSWLVLSFSSESPPAQPRTFRAAVYQCNCSLPNALFSLKRATDALRRAARHGVELVVFPEMFLPGRDISHSIEKQPKGALDREAYELNVLGQLSNEFGVACVVPYVEKPHESEGIGSDLMAFSSAAVFHADGSRAGNYRRTMMPSALAKNNFLGEGNPIVEALPININLKSTSIQCGVIMGDELVSSPEQARYLVRSGTELLLVVGTAVGSDGCHTSVTSDREARHILPTRAIENCVHVLCASYEGSIEDKSADDTNTFTGLSAIVSPSGEELIRAPPSHIIEGYSENGSGEDDQENGQDTGRVVYGVEGSSIIPCEDGTLYVAPIKIDKEDCAARNKCADASNSRWDVLPKHKGNRSNGGKTTPNKNRSTNSPTDKQSGNKGFGAANPKAKKNNRAKKRKYYELD